MVDAHVGFWSLTLVFFVISYILLVLGKAKGQKITHMILRLLYVLVFGTGLTLVITYGIDYSYWMAPIFKGIGGLIILSMMEMILVKKKKDNKTSVFWIILILALLFVFYMGYSVIKVG